MHSLGTIRKPEKWPPWSFMSLNTNFSVLISDKISHKFPNDSEIGNKYIAGGLDDMCSSRKLPKFILLTPR